MDYMFMTRPYWLELSIPQKVVNDTNRCYFGNDNLDISSRKKAIDFLLKITGRIQEKMVLQLQGETACYLLKDLYKILDEAFHFYIRQKEARKKLSELNIQDESILDVFEENRNKSCNVIDAVNLWIENAVLLNNNLGDCEDKSFDVNNELFVEMMIDPEPVPDSELDSTDKPNSSGNGDVTSKKPVSDSNKDKSPDTGSAVGISLAAVILTGFAVIASKKK